MLSPQLTPTRTQISLDGIWNFRLLESGESPAPGELLSSTIPMPVPCSYNEIYPGRTFRDHVGRMAYQRTLCVTKEMKAQRLVLRFASVTHKAEVYWNGVLLGSHKGGFLPFEFDVTGIALVGDNLLTVFVLDAACWPHGYANLPRLSA